MGTGGRCPPAALGLPRVLLPAGHPGGRPPAGWAGQVPCPRRLPAGVPWAGGCSCHPWPYTEFWLGLHLLVLPQPGRVWAKRGHGFGRGLHSPGQA